MAMNPRLLRPRATPSATFDPRVVSGMGMWLDASDRSTLSQTSDGSTAVTSNNDPVAYWKDKITGVALTQTTDANRPLWLANGIGGRPGLDFDGSNDVLSATSGSLMSLFRSVGAGTMIFAHRLKSTSASLGPLLFTSTGTSSGAGRFFVARAVQGDRYVLGSRRTDAQSFFNVLSGAGTLTTSAAIASSIHRVSAAQASLRLNGSSLISNAAFQDAGNTSDTNSLQVAVGGAADAGAFAPCILCEVMAWPRELTLAEIQTLERYLSIRYGISVA
jgi:hypothetical protein